MYKLFICDTFEDVTFLVDMHVVILLSDDHLECTHDMNEKGVALHNFCGSGIEEDLVTFNCTLSYRGNIPPRLAWSSANMLNGSWGHEITNVKFNDKVWSALRVNASMLVNNTIKCHLELTSFGNSSIGAVTYNQISWATPDVNFYCKSHYVYSVSVSQLFLYFILVITGYRRKLYLGL